MFLASCPCRKNKARKQAGFVTFWALSTWVQRYENCLNFATEITVFLVKRKGLLRLHANPSVRSIYNPLRVEYESICTGIVGMVYLVHWSILYRSSGLTFSFDPSPFSWLVSPANRRTRMCLFFRSFCLWRWFAEPPSRCLHITAAIATESPSLKSSALFCPHSLRLYAGR